MKGDAMTKLLYLECTSGISGDMCAAALLDAGASEEAVRRALESLPVEGFAVEISRVKKSGLDVCDFSVVLDAAHENHDHDMAYLYSGVEECGHTHDVHEHNHDEHDHHHDENGHEHRHGIAATTTRLNIPTTMNMTTHTAGWPRCWTS